MLCLVKQTAMAAICLTLSCYCVSRALLFADAACPLCRNFAMVDENLLFLDGAAIIAFVWDSVVAVVVYDVQYLDSLPAWK